MTLKISRRNFLISTGTIAGALVLGVSLSSSRQGLPNARAKALHPNAWLQVTSDGQVIFQLDKVEMGQGVLTSMTTIIAEELEVDPRTIVVEQAPVHEDFQIPLQVTGGSTSTNTRWDILRKTGATAREMLIMAAASKWQVEVSECHAENAMVWHKKSAKSLPYAKLAEAASKLPVIESPTLKDANKYKYINKSLRRFDGMDKSIGKAEFGIDVIRPNTFIAVVIRNPHFGGRILRTDLSKAKSANGVVEVFEISSGIAVLADSYWHARKAADLVSVDWDKGAMAGVSDDSIRATWESKMQSEEGEVVRSEGNVQDTFNSADQVHETIYETPYLAHATMEPQNATAEFNGDICSIWAPNQGPDLLQAMVAEQLSISKDKVLVHTTLMGGGFGRRVVSDFAVEAAEIAYKSKRTVKLIWSREDDMRHDYYRPASYHKLSAALDAAGMVKGWTHKMISPGILSSLLPYVASLAPNWVPDWIGSFVANTAGYLMETSDPTTYEGAAELPYQIDNIEVRNVFHDPGIPIGFWRSVGHSHNAFMAESFIDELAYKADKDPYLFRQKLLQGNERHLTPLNLVAEKAGWGNAKRGVYQGIAVHESFGSVVAQVAELRMHNGLPRVERVVCVVDCGTAVNPDLVVAQMESGIIFGMTAALKGKISLIDGAVVQSNFHDYGLLRMSEAPEIEVHIIPSKATPTGVGEPGTPPIAPAIGNAFFAATGKRLRKLPFEWV